jgi:hypothetical protein
MSSEMVPSEGRFLSEASHDDLFEVMKTSMSNDIAGMPKRGMRRAFLKGVFVAGLALGIGFSIVGPAKADINPSQQECWIVICFGNYCEVYILT